MADEDQECRAKFRQSEAEAVLRDGVIGAAVKGGQIRAKCAAAAEPPDGFFGHCHDSQHHGQCRFGTSRGRLTVVDTANALDTSPLWRRAAPAPGAAQRRRGARDDQLW